MSRSHNLIDSWSRSWSFRIPIYMCDNWRAFWFRRKWWVWNRAWIIVYFLFEARIFRWITTLLNGGRIRCKYLGLQITSTAKNFSFESPHIIACWVSPVRDAIRAYIFCCVTRWSVKNTICISLRFHLSTFECNTCEIIWWLEILQWSWTKRKRRRNNISIYSTIRPIESTHRSWWTGNDGGCGV